MFKEDGERVEDEPLSGRSFTSTERHSNRIFGVSQ